MDRGDRAWTAQDAHFQGLPVKRRVVSPAAVPGVAYAWPLQGVPGMSVSERLLSFCPRRPPGPACMTPRALPGEVAPPAGGRAETRAL